MLEVRRRRRKRSFPVCSVNSQWSTWRHDGVHWGKMSTPTAFTQNLHPDMLIHFFVDYVDNWA